MLLESRKAGQKRLDEVAKMVEARTAKAKQDEVDKQAAEAVQAPGPAKGLRSGVRGLRGRGRKRRGHVLFDEPETRLSDRVVHARRPNRLLTVGRLSDRAGGTDTNRGTGRESAEGPSGILCKNHPRVLRHDVLHGHRDRPGHVQGRWIRFVFCHLYGNGPRGPPGMDQFRGRCDQARRPEDGPRPLDRQDVPQQQQQTNQHQQQPRRKGLGVHPGTHHER